MVTRRDFLKHATLISLAPTVPGFLAQTARGTSPRADERILVVIQLSGGNDGLNMVVPYSDETYYRMRPKLAVAKDRVRRLGDTVGLNPEMRDAAELFHDGRLAIVQGVGYPNPNKSHDVSMSIWQTARFDPTEHRGYGWIGRALDESPALPKNGPSALLVGKDAPPVALRGRRAVEGRRTLDHTASRREENSINSRANRQLSFGKRAHYALLDHDGLNQRDSESIPGESPGRWRLSVPAARLSRSVRSKIERFHQPSPLTRRTDGMKTAVPASARLYPPAD